MATIDSQILSARYDLRDEDETQYPDALLLDFFNRSLRVLDSFLGKTKSDWVLTLSPETLLTDDNSLALPSNFKTTREVRIDTNSKLEKKDAVWILAQQQCSSSGTPYYYAEHKLNMIFERVAAADLTVNIYYNAKSAELELEAPMPYNDEFNDSLRGATVMQAKARNNRDIMSDHALYQFFQEAESGTKLKRSYAPKKRTNY